MHVDTCWTQPLRLTETLDLLRDLALGHAHMSGPYSTDLTNLLLEENYVGLVEYEMDYTRGATASDVLHARQALGFFQKLEPMDIGVDKEAVAYRKFQASESRCRETNELFRALRSGNAMLRPHVWQTLLSARRKIRGVLGKCPSLVSLKLRFGPGATTSIRRSDANPVTKMASGLQCSIDALASARLPELLREIPHWSDAYKTATIEKDGWEVDVVPVDIVPGRLAFVPKSAKTYRSIVVEPCLNTFVQAGIGDFMARRLRTVGIDIRDQSANQRAALLGSLDGSLATIDLSSASDLISRELVRFLLPADWYSLLSAWRTSHVVYGDEDLFLEKFSSMGNGFTFPLETLIFYCLTQSVCHDPRVLAYGDDIICPSELADQVIAILNVAGFEVNSAKSYSSGPFRESCGKDYYLGINVRPFYQKHLVSGRTLFTLHNFYARAYDFDRAAQVRKLIPRPLRIYGPDGYGDGHLISSDWKRLHRKKDLSRGYGGSYFETYSAITRKWLQIYPGDWVSPLYSIYTRAEVPISDALPHFPVYESNSPVDTSRKARPEWTLPGEDGYKRKLIYTLAH